MMNKIKIANERINYFEKKLTLTYLILETLYQQTIKYKKQ